MFYPMSLLTTVGWRAAESLEQVWEVPYFGVSLNTNPKGKYLPLSVKNTQVFFHNLLWFFLELGINLVHITIYQHKLCCG